MAIYTGVHKQVRSSPSTQFLTSVSLSLLPLCPVSPDGKPGSAKKRRKSMSSGLAQGKTGSPSTSFNPAAMTERQQMAYLLQMTDPHKKTGESPHPTQMSLRVSTVTFGLCTYMHVYSYNVHVHILYMCVQWTVCKYLCLMLIHI